MEKVNTTSPLDDTSIQGHLAGDGDSNSRIETFVAPALLTTPSELISPDLLNVAAVIDGKLNLTYSTPSVSQKFLVERAKEGDDYAMHSVHKIFEDGCKSCEGCSRQYRRN